VLVIISVYVKNIFTESLKLCLMLESYNTFCSATNLTSSIWSPFSFFFKYIAVTDKKLNSFLRGCEDNPRVLNGVVSDSQFQTYYSSCTRNLCNIGDGKGSTSGSPGGDPLSPNGPPNGPLMVPSLSASCNLLPGVAILLPLTILAMLSWWDILRYFELNIFNKYYCT
jgi:hypothetical protein